MIKAMRISCREIAAIKELAKACFGAEAVVYLFGSRVDDGKRGGDIDLYIETDERDAVRVLDAKYDFLAKLKRRIGDQRIDVVVSYPSRQQIPPVVEVARRTGVRL
jgi:predicted nucleotidyltransferase